MDLWNFVNRRSLAPDCEATGAELKIGHVGTMETERLNGRLPLVLFSPVGVDVEERIDAFEQSCFDLVRRAVNDM